MALGQHCARRLPEPAVTQYSEGNTVHRLIRSYVSRLSSELSHRFCGLSFNTDKTDNADVIFGTHNLQTCDVAGLASEALIS